MQPYLINAQLAAHLARLVPILSIAVTLASRLTLRVVCSLVTQQGILLGHQLLLCLGRRPGTWSCTYRASLASISRTFHVICKYGLLLKDIRPMWVHICISPLLREHDLISWHLRRPLPEDIDRQAAIGHCWLLAGCQAAQCLAGKLHACMARVQTSRNRLVLAEQHR